MHSQVRSYFLEKIPHHRYKIQSSDDDKEHFCGLGTKWNSHRDMPRYRMLK